MATRALNPRRPAPRGSRTATQRRAPKAASQAALWRRRGLVCALLVLVIYAGYMLWFRNLSWFAIDKVTVDGATTNTSQIGAAIQRASGDMTTLHVKDGELRD